MTGSTGDRSTPRQRRKGPHVGLGQAGFRRVGCGLLVLLASCGQAHAIAHRAAFRHPATTAATESSTPQSSTPDAPPATRGSAGRDGTSRAAMLAAFSAGNSAYQRCMVDPARCDTAALARTYAGSALANVRHFVARLRAAHLRVRYPGPDSYYGVVVTAIVNGAGLGSVTECGVDGGVLYQPLDPANPADDVIVNDQLLSSRDVWAIRLIGGAWRRVSYRNVATWTGVNRCPARSA